MSPDERFLAILHTWQNGLTETALYTAIGLLPEFLNFGENGHTVWARKVISISTRAISGNCSTHPTAFGSDGFLYCAYGRVDLMSGVEEEIFGKFDMLEPWNITFSGDGQTAVRSIDHARILDYILPGGGTKILHRYESGTVLKPQALSQTGRFLAWTEICHGQYVTIHRCRIYDKRLCTLNEL